jgi:valyl-tRNA synthetase
MTRDLPKNFNPRDVESRWYAHWEASGYFRADAHSTKPTFVIMMPPPNVTGSLHIGHMLNHTVQDVVVRWKRMSGFNTLWLPGMDHAGIATQNVVERELRKEGKTRHDLGREKFVERVWEWKKEYGGKILHQIRRIGDSCDWSRERFTFDEGLSQAVREIFVQLYDEGLIYRGKRLINWCPRCLTALSDLEVKYETADSKLYHIRYPLKEKPGRAAAFVEVATTRPETMLGDTAVAVHPDDKRYHQYRGDAVILPPRRQGTPVCGGPGGRSKVRNRHRQSDAGSRSGGLRDWSAARAPADQRDW